MNINNTFICIKVKNASFHSSFSGLSMFFSETLRDHPDKTAGFIKQMGMITAKSGFLDSAAISGRASYLDFFLWLD